MLHARNLIAVLVIVLAVLLLPACTALALLLQRRRLEAERARDEALAASELNRLLMSLLAHDLRSPLAVSDQAFGYVEDSLGAARSIDRALIGDVRARLRRSLRAIDIVLGLARAHAEPAAVPSEGGGRATPHVRAEIEAEVASFAHEAEVRGKTLVAELDGVGGARLAADVLVLRQALAILLDNAIRYADAGPVRVRAATRGCALHVHVEDGGPGLSAPRREGGGAGLGLKLCHALVRRAGGALELARDGADGTEFLLRLPLVGSEKLEG